MATDKTEGSSLHLKLSNLLFGLIIFFSATQLGFHFWPLSSLVYGIRIDYLAPTLYFLDILIVAFLFLRRLFDRRPKQSSSLPAQSGWDAEGVRSLLIGVIPVLLVNLLYSANPLATLSWSLHFILYFAFLATLSPQFRSLRDSRRVIGTLRLSLIAALVFQLLLSIAQVSLGHSVGGLMYCLGERSVAVGQPAVALGTFMDSVVLRAYGTFGHPNVLAGWSVVALLITIQLHKQRAVRKFGIYFPLLLTTLIVLLTQSRSAALTLFALVIPFYAIKKFKPRLIYFAIILSSLFYLLPSMSPPRSDLSTSQRLSLQGLSLKVIAQHPVFGTGTQASISVYPSVAPENRLLQPDHNSLTLFLSWFGIFGLLAIVYVLRSSLSSIFYLLIPLAPLLALDHYPPTSPQGLFIVLTYSYVALNYSHAQKNL